MVAVMQPIACLMSDASPLGILGLQPLLHVESSCGNIMWSVLVVLCLGVTRRTTALL